MQALQAQLTNLRDKITFLFTNCHDKEIRQGENINKEEPGKTEFSTPLY
jgi:hypothetical protein